MGANTKRSCRNDESGITPQSIRSRARNNQQEISNKGWSASEDRGEGIRQGNGEIGTGRVNSADKYGIVANTESERYRGYTNQECPICEWSLEPGKRAGSEVGYQTEGCTSNAPDTTRRESREQAEPEGGQGAGGRDSEGRDAPDTSGDRSKTGISEQGQRPEGTTGILNNGIGERNWWQEN